MGTSIPHEFPRSKELGVVNATVSSNGGGGRGFAMSAKWPDVRTSLVLTAVRGEIAADQDDFTAPELRLAAHLHRHSGELLSAAQYEEMADVREAEV